MGSGLEENQLVLGEANASRTLWTRCIVTTATLNAAVYTHLALTLMGFKTYQLRETMDHPAADGRGIRSRQAWASESVQTLKTGNPSPETRLPRIELCTQASDPLVSSSPSEG